jgi:hypothetical protein
VKGNAQRTIPETKLTYLGLIIHTNFRKVMEDFFPEMKNWTESCNII